MPSAPPISALALRVVAARQLEAYQVAVTFSDGATRVVDVAPFLRRSHHPAVRAYLDPARFATFAVRDGDLMWGDYDLIFPLEDLYRGGPLG